VFIERTNIFYHELTAWHRTFREYTVVTMSHVPGFAHSPKFRYRILHEPPLIRICIIYKCTLFGVFSSAKTWVLFCGLWHPI